MRSGIAATLGLLAGVLAGVAGRGLFGAPAAAILLGLASAAVVGALVFRRPPVLLDDEAATRPLRLLGAATAVLAVVQVARLAVFTVDPARIGYSAVPNSEWEVRHSCLSAYAVAGRVAGHAPNIYEDALYSLPSDDPTAPRVARLLGPFRVDVYEYPPPFLLLPRALSWSTGEGLPSEPEFGRLRMLWFALDVGLIVVALVGIARLLPPAAGTRALLLAPLVLIALPTASTVQKGNVQGMILAGSMLAMALFERGRSPGGGLLLAFAGASKLYPGLLGVYLLARRRWRDAAWTVACGAGFVLLSLLAFGRAPWVAFLEHMPRLLSGESFPAFRNPMAMAINLSIPGLVYKAHVFGAPASFAAMQVAGWIYTLVAVAAILLAARRALRPEDTPALWLAILILATLRSPFLPQGYGVFPALWLLTLLAARASMTPRRLGLVLLVWAGLNIVWPMDWPIDPRVLALLSSVPQALLILLAVLALVPPRAPAPGEDVEALRRAA